MFIYVRGEAGGRFPSRRRMPRSAPVPGLPAFLINREIKSKILLLIIILHCFKVLMETVLRE
jgi:hypothetical protein